MELFDALVQNDGRCILDDARDGDRGGDTEPHDHDREGDLGDDHEGGHLVALHALGRLAEDGLERDAGKGKVHAGEANGHEHDHPDGTGLDAGHEGEELGDEQGERREGGEREQGCPDKKFYPVAVQLTCMNMKVTTLMDIYNCLKGQGGEEIFRPENIMEGAGRCIHRMVELGG